MIETLLVTGSFVAIVSVAQWLIVYSLLDPWWGSQIGRSLVLFAVFSMVTPALFILSLLFDLNRATSQALAWVEIAVLFSYAPAMFWRSLIWVGAARREGRRDARRAAVLADEGDADPVEGG